MKLLLAVPLVPLLVAAVACSGDSPAATPTVEPTHTPTRAEASETPTPGRTTAPPLPTPTPDRLGRVTLNAVGDIMLERDLITLMDENGSIYPFASVAVLLGEADLTIGNMEGTFTERGVRADKFYAFRTPPRHAAGLTEAGIDIVSVGNNHAMDYGAEGLEDTLDALVAEGVLYSGAGSDEAAAREPALATVNGLTIAFLSYNAAATYEAFPAGASTPGVARADVASIREDVSAALQDTDVVVVSLHAGAEYTDAPTAEQTMLARAAIDAGAALVLGHHPHVLQGWERYGDGYIFYSLGNFVFDLDFNDLETLGPRPFQSVILRVELTAAGVESFEMLPVFIDPAENRPVPATGDRLREIEERLDLLNAPGSVKSTASTRRASASASPRRR